MLCNRVNIDFILGISSLTLPPDAQIYFPLEAFGLEYPFFAEDFNSYIAQSCLRRFYRGISFSHWSSAYTPLLWLRSHTYRCTVPLPFGWVTNLVGNMVCSVPFRLHLTWLRSASFLWGPQVTSLRSALLLLGWPGRHRSWEVVGGGHKIKRVHPPLPSPVALHMFCYCDGQGPPQSSTVVGSFPGRCASNGRWALGPCGCLTEVFGPSPSTTFSRNPTD